MSSPLQHWNAATTRSFTQFTRLGQKPHHFGHRIAEDDARRPTSPGLKIDEIAKPGSLPEPTTGDAFVESELRCELAERHLILVQRRNSIHCLPNRGRNRCFDPLGE